MNDEIAPICVSTSPNCALVSVIVAPNISGLSTSDRLAVDEAIAVGAAFSAYDVRRRPS